MTFTNGLKKIGESVGSSIDKTVAAALIASTMATSALAQQSNQPYIIKMDRQVGYPNNTEYAVLDIKFPESGNYKVIKSTDLSSWTNGANQSINVPRNNFIVRAYEPVGTDGKQFYGLKKN
jgi:hypothetical protein